jgi:hypothetical protein
MSSRALIASVIALTSTGYAIAGVPSVFYTVDSAAWSTYATNAGASISTENFSTVNNGVYGSGVAGSVSGITWSASANGGVRVDAGLLSTSVGSATLNFAFTPGVNGIAGNIYGTDAQWTAVPATILVTLSDGTAYYGNSNGPADFIGFYSNGATISSLSIVVYGEGVNRATVDNLYFATVPAPGAAALIGLAGVVARRRERRA